MGYIIFYYFAPPYSLIWILPLWGIVALIISSSRKKLDISISDLAEENALKKLTYALWGLSILAGFLSIIVMGFVSAIFPDSLGVVHSEWGIVYERAYVEAVIYLFLWAAAYASPLIFAKKTIQKQIVNEEKSHRFHIRFLVFSGIWWLVFNGLAHTILFGIYYYEDMARMMT